jgi:hypothetical protein
MADKTRVTALAKHIVFLEHDAVTFEVVGQGRRGHTVHHWVTGSAGVEGELTT